MHRVYTLLCLWGLMAGICRAEIAFPALDHLVSRTPLEVQRIEAMNLIGRMVPGRLGEFVVKMNTSIGPPHRDTFWLVTEDDKLVITATSGVAAALGFHYYVKRWNTRHISWSGDRLDLHRPLIVISPGNMVKVTTNDRFMYYLNPTTFSYTAAFWNFTSWEREIDWMAMQGVNLPLAHTAQEAIWQRVYLGLGVKQSELDAFFGGPAFLAWSRLGNIRGWGGPLPKNWHIQQMALQQKILQRMRVLG